MSVIGSNILAGASGQAVGYQVERSLRFNSSDSAYLSRTPASAGNRKTWTWAGWVKRAKFTGIEQYIFSHRLGSPNNQVYVRFDSSTEKLRVAQVTNNSVDWNVEPAANFRDTSAWYHIVAAVDTTQATASNRVRIYVNGVEQTSFTAASYPTQNSDTYINSTVEHRFGASDSLGFDGYLAECYLIDGQALTPSSFTEVSATTGQLIPKKYTGTFGTNGFWLQFADNSNNTATTLGKDTSGNGNNWTPFNLQTITGGPTSVAAASGALPIHNTTDTYGATKGSGTRTDSNSSSIVLAIPMDGANNGTTFTDESATIKGSGSAKSITVIGNTKTVTAQSKYYGSSGYFDGAGDYLQIASTADLTVGTGAFTAECWVYPLAQSGILFQNYDNANGGWSLRIQDLGNAINGVSNVGPLIGFTSGTLPTSKWSHIAAVWSATGSNCSVYVNGVLARTISNIPSSTQATFWIGAQGDQGPGAFFFGYLQDLRVYKGVAKYTSNFNPPTATQIPSVAAGNDSLVDTPTSYGTDDSLGGSVRGNYATLNPLDKANIGSAVLSNGNLDYNSTSGGNRAPSTIGVSSGKWYMEMTANTSGNASWTVGVIDSATGSIAVSYYAFDGKIYPAGTTYGNTYTAGDVIGVALDLDNGKIFFSKNGTWQNSGNPTTGTNPAASSLSGTYAFFVGHGSGASTSTSTANFGQRQWAYQAPAGFRPLVDTCLPAPVVAKPNTVFDVVKYIGNGTAQTVSGLNFSPDFLWGKNRSSAFYHILVDSIRGATARLFSNTTDAESVFANSFTAFTSNGFSVGSASDVNNNNDAIVTWCWDAGTSTVTNTQGSITSSVRANASAGFSVVTFSKSSGTSTTDTVGHGLNVAPYFVITKQRNGTEPWYCYHQALGASARIQLNETSAQTTGTTVWGSTSPTSSVFSIRNVFNGDYVAYCFAPVAGYSSFGSYVGNGSSDGVFVWTGHRSRWIMIKQSSASGEAWLIHDTARDTYNVSNKLLFPNLANAETTAAGGTGYDIDILSNGFKIRNSNPAWNANGATYIYASFAESPFAYSRAR